MLRLLHRSRLLALILLLATPALGGAWLQAVHPCPVDAPWAAAHPGEHADHGAGQQSGSGGCHCVSVCAGAAPAVLPAAPVVPLAAAPLPEAAPVRTPLALPPAFRPSDRLPPATAPPLG